MTKGGVVNAPKCTAHTRSGKPCGRYALRGTNVCEYHGGKSPQVQRKIAREEETIRTLEQARRDVQLFGGRIDIHPAEALLQLVGSKAAEVAYWESRVAELEHDDLVWGLTREKTGGDDHGSTFEAKITVALDQLHIAQRDLAQFAAASLKAGVDEAHVKLRQSQAEQAVAVLRAALTDPRVAVAADVAHDVILDAIRGMQAADH